uniref:Uncharacterized protein n=1 Tax=Rhinolophus ferrumequinum TaxID=59479 RepID=A0A671DNK2_RHIFE
VGENAQDGTLGSWFKIKVPDGMKYDKTWLMNSIQRHCSVPFTPVDFHYVKNWAQFFVQDASAASALKDISYKICDEENKKIPIFVSTSAVPYSVRDKLEPKEMEQLKLTMTKRYDPSQKALDLQSLRYDPDLVGLDIDIILNRRNCMAATLQIIKKNFPELLSLNLRNNKLHQLDGLSDLIQIAPTVKILNLSRNELKSACELDKMKGLKLEELWLEENPFCGTFPDQSTYIRKHPHWPDQHLLFLFSPRSSLFEYFKDNRNMKNLKDPFLRVQLLKHTKRDIVGSLCVLPKTQHDLLSFVVDMWFQTVSTCFFSGAGPESCRWGCCLLLWKWMEILKVLCVPSAGPSSLPLPAVPGESCTVGGNTQPSLGPGVWKHAFPWGFLNIVEANR